LPEGFDELSPNGAGGGTPDATYSFSSSRTCQLVKDGEVFTAASRKVPSSRVLVEV
jgi:hypothetical protein